MIKVTGLTRFKDVIISSGIVPPTNNGPVLTTKMYNFVTYESMNTTPSLTELVLRETLIPLSTPPEALGFVPSLTRLGLPPEIATKDALGLVPSLSGLNFSITYDRYGVTPVREALSTIPSLTELTLT